MKYLGKFENIIDKSELQNEGNYYLIYENKKTTSLFLIGRFINIIYPRLKCFLFMIVDNKENTIVENDHEECVEVVLSEDEVFLLSDEETKMFLLNII